MIKTVRVAIPTNKPKETIELSEFIIGKHTADGVSSALAGVIDMVAFGNLVTDAKDKRRQADLKDRSAQEKYDAASVNAGTGKGQTKDVKETVIWYVRQIRDLLLIKHNGTEEALTEYGFNVVINTTGSRRTVRVTIPEPIAELLELAADIIEHHTTLGAGSPLTAALVDMAAFETLTTDTTTLLNEWTVLRGEVQALNNDALTTLGYAPGQTSTTVGTIYNILGNIRKRLLQKHQGREEAVSNWGFDVIMSEKKASKKKENPEFSITGTVTNSESGEPVSGALVLVLPPDIFVSTNEQGKYFVPTLPAGNYTMRIHKADYIEQELPNVAVTAGAVTTVNFQLVALFPIFFEGDLNMGNTDSFDMLNLDTAAHPNLNFIFENLSTTVHRYFAASSPDDLPGAGAVLDVAPGLAIPKTRAELIALLGFNETKRYLVVLNMGPAPAHFKVIIEE